jgi:hypothetical protein
MFFKNGEKLHKNIYYLKAGDFFCCIQSLEESIHKIDKTQVKSFILFIFWVSNISVYHSYLLRVQKLNKLIPMRDYMLIVTKSGFDKQILYSKNEILELMPLVAKATYIVNIDALKFPFVKSWVKSTIKNN